MSNSENRELNNKLARRNLLCAFAAMGTVAAAPYYAGAANFVRGGGDVRVLNMRNDRTGEVLNAVYWIEGKYVDEVMTQVNLFFRDWRQNKAIEIDPRAVDIIAATHRMLDTTEPYLLISGYRTPQTNRALSGTATRSFHMRGMAADLRLGSRSVSQMARAAHAVKSGGVGTYHGSNFVHMDSGPIRSWRG